MNAVGIDVSKGKSMMMALQPMNQVVLKPREYPHTEAGLDQMAHDIRVTVMNPLFIKQSGGGSIRKVKTDKIVKMRFMG